MDVTQRVRAIVEESIGAGHDSAVQVAAYVGGELVVNVAAGSADEGGTPIGTDTLINGWSVGKGATSTLAHRLVGRGVLELDAPVAQYWPEFAAQGKDKVTLRHVLTHSAGVPQCPQPFTVADLGRWEEFTARIAELPLLWQPGTQSGYHGLTYGYIVGEVIQRATGTPLRTALVEEVTGPLGIAEQVRFGVTDDEITEVATLRDGGWEAMLDSMPAEANFHRAIPPNVAIARVGNTPEYLTACYPGGAIATAHGLARMYAALLGPVDGVRMVDEAALDEITTPAMTGPDWTMGVPITRGLGFYLDLATVSDRQGSFGFSGSGSNMAFAERSTGLAFAFLHTTMTAPPPQSAQRLAAAIREELSL